MPRQQQSWHDLEQALLNTLTTTTEHQSRRRVALEEEAEKLVVPAPVEERAPVVDLSHNPFMIIKKGTASENKKAEQIKDKVAIVAVDPLKITTEDIESANKLFGEFELYYRSIQDTSIDTDLDAIRQLIDRIKHSISPEMATMITKLTGQNININECKDLLDVLKTAHIMKKTVEQLREAVRENARLETLMAEQRDELKTLNEQKVVLDQNVTTATDAVAADGAKTFGSFRHSWIGVPTHLASALQRAEKAQADKKSTIDVKAAELAGNEALYQAALATGPLRILRSFNMTQENLEKKIQDAAQDTIDTVESIRRSVKILLDRVGKSEVAMNSIVGRIDNVRLDRTTLIAALTQAYKENQEKADKVGAHAEELHVKLEGGERDSIEATETRIEHLTQTTNHQNILRYGERINKLLQVMQKSDASSVLAQHDADEVLTSVLNNKDGLNELYNHTLPTLSQAMGLVLHQFVDDQDQEFRMGISAITQDLGRTAEGTAERALEQQKYFHEQKVEALKHLIEQLDGSSTLLGKFMKEQVSGAVEEQQQLGKLRNSAEHLRDGVESHQRILSEVRKRVRGMAEAADEVMTGGTTEDTADAEPTPPADGGNYRPPGSTAKAFAL